MNDWPETSESLIARIKDQRMLLRGLRFWRSIVP